MPIRNQGGDDIRSYPSPFFDLSNANQPVDMDELLDWCIYYYLATPLIPAVINKLSTYPITDVIVETSKEDSKKKWNELLKKKLHVAYKMFENNLDYFLMGANFTSIYIPFVRSLVCNKCGTSVPMNGANWKVSFAKKGRGKNNKISRMPAFSLKCDVCGSVQAAEIQDNVLKDWNRINLVRYSPKHIKPIRDPISGRSKYLWSIPQKYQETIKGGRHPEFIEACPAEVLEAINTDGKLLLSDDNIYEMRRPSVSSDGCERGIPIVMHALKWTYYLAILQSGQEAIAHEKIIPNDILFPASAGNSSAAPSQTLSMGNFTTNLEAELKKKRSDPGRKIIMPTAVGSVRLGGDARNMMLAAEIDWVSKQIIASMGVPIEFVYGGLTWTGSSITLRMLENSMIGIRDNSEEWLQWVVDKIGASFCIDSPVIKLAELKMADDIQRQNIIMQLEAGEKIATSTMLNEFDIDFMSESKKILKEAETKAKLIINSAVTSAKAQGTAAIVQNDYMMRSQLIQQGQSAASGLDPATGYPTDPNSGVPVDPNTGFPIDPAVGLPMDPQTGQYIDPNTGMTMSVEEAQEYAMLANQDAAAQQNTQNAPTQGDQGVPGSAVDNAIYSQDEQKTDSQDAAAQQAMAYNNLTPEMKNSITNVAKEIIMADTFTADRIMKSIQQQSPNMIKLIHERIGMLNSGME